MAPMPWMSATPPPAGGWDRRKAPPSAPDPQVVRRSRLAVLAARLRREANRAEDITEMYELLERARRIEERIK